MDVGGRAGRYAGMKLLVDRVLHDEVKGKAGDTVYMLKQHDFGCAREDTEETGIEHISVTHNPNGGYPFFTVSINEVEA